MRRCKGEIKKGNPKRGHRNRRRKGIFEFFGPTGAEQGPTRTSTSAPRQSWPRDLGEGKAARLWDDAAWWSSGDQFARQCQAKDDRTVHERHDHSRDTCVYGRV